MFIEAVAIDQEIKKHGPSIARENLEIVMKLTSSIAAIFTYISVAMKAARNAHLCDNNEMLRERRAEMPKGIGMCREIKSDEETAVRLGKKCMRNRNYCADFMMSVSEATIV